MLTKFAVVGCNIIAAHEEPEMSALLLLLHSQDFVHNVYAQLLSGLIQHFCWYQYRIDEYNLDLDYLKTNQLIHLFNLHKLPSTTNKEHRFCFH